MASGVRWLFFVARPGGYVTARDRREAERRARAACGDDPFLWVQSVASAEAALVERGAVSLVRSLPADAGPLRAQKGRGVLAAEVPLVDEAQSLRVLAEAFHAVAEALPPGTPVAVPAGVLLRLLEGHQASEDGPGAVDLTVADLAERYGRRPSTVRMWLERGDFPQAYRFQNREWRVPSGAVAEFDRARRGPPRPTKGRAVDLGSWRRATSSEPAE